MFDDSRIDLFRVSDRGQTLVVTCPTACNTTSEAGFRMSSHVFQFDGTQKCRKWMNMVIQMMINS